MLSEQGSRQLSAFVCIHQPDGFKDLLTRDFCCRRLFIFAGAEVLPGSGFGSRSLLRSSRSVPTVACRSSACSPGCWCRCAIPGNPSCCCTDGNFSKKREGWTVPALLTEPNIKGSEIFSKKLKFRIVFTVQ